MMKTMMIIVTTIMVVEIIQSLQRNIISPWDFNDGDVIDGCNSHDIDDSCDDFDEDHTTMKLLSMQHKNMIREV